MQAGQETVEEGASWDEEEEGLAGTFRRPVGRTPAPAEGRTEGGCCCSSRGQSRGDRTGAGLENVALWNKECTLPKILHRQFTDDELKSLVCSRGLPLL